MGSSSTWDTAQTSMKEKFKLSAANINWFEQIRNGLRNLASSGVSTSPDFTLHNEIHSDNLVVILGVLSEFYRLKLTKYEIYLLLTSVYLHDIGMFFGKERFLEDIFPHFSDVLKFCDGDICDGGSKYHDVIKGKSVGFQIRAVHHLLTAYMLQEDGKEVFRLPTEDIPHIIAICRGHRKANIRKTNCSCYENKLVKAEYVRRDLLAALLRFSDALDLFPDRAPNETFLSRSQDFLKDPNALKHWMKHYFSTAVHTTINSNNANKYLDCKLSITLPGKKKINNISYESFLLPMFEEFATDARKDDFNIINYPPIFHEMFGIKEIQFNYHLDLDGANELPSKILQSIETTNCKNVLDFINNLEEIIGKEDQQNLVEESILDRRPEVQAFKTLMDGDDPQHSLLLMVGESGQGKTWLMRKFEKISLERQVTYLRLDLKVVKDFEEILDGIWQCLGQHHFPNYSKYRIRPKHPFNLSTDEHLKNNTNIFFEEWSSISDDHQIVILLDTYESTSQIIKEWIEISFLEKLQTISQAVVVIGGQIWPGIDDYWQNHCYRFPLTGVQLKDYENYAIHKKVVIPKNILIELHQKFNGHPKSFTEYIESLSKEQV